MVLSSKALERWDFRHEGSDCWTWQRVDVLGCASGPSITHKSFGSVISDAMSHGFSPQKHGYLVEDIGSVTRFAPGEIPQVLRK